MPDEDFGLPSTHIKRDETKKDIIRFFYEPVGLDLPEIEMIPTFAADPFAVDRVTMETFLDENKEKFKVDMKNLRQILAKETEGFSSVSFLQHHDDVPVYGATITANIKKDRSTIFGLNNFYDYDIEELDLEPKISKEKALEIVNQSLQEFFSNFEAKVLHKYIYRHFDHNYNKKDQLQYLGEKYHEFFKKIESEELNDRDQILVWQVFAVVADPIITSFEILVNATSGKIVKIQDRNSYRIGKGLIFKPDPVISSKIRNIKSDKSGRLIPSDRFYPHTTEVNLKNLYEPDNDHFYLKGKYCRIIEVPFSRIGMQRVLSIPEPGPPKIKDQPNVPNFEIDFTIPDFNDDKHLYQFLCVMSYYWIDKVQTYIQEILEIKDAGNYDIQIDPHGLPTWMDNACFLAGIVLKDEVRVLDKEFLKMILDYVIETEDYENLRKEERKGTILLGLGGNPEAADASVTIHEYAHAIHYNQGFPGDDYADLMEGFADILPQIYFDRFNDQQILREQIFPFDNNPGLKDDFNKLRNVNLDFVFDEKFPKRKMYVRGDMWATLVWKMYLALGGGSNHKWKREWAADLILKLHFEANKLVGSFSSGILTPKERFQLMCFSLMIANSVMMGWHSIPDNLYQKVIRAKAVNMKLLKPLKDEFYIGNYKYLENERLDEFQNCKDIINRREKEKPAEMRNEKPLPGQKNYIWLKVKRRGRGQEIPKSPEVNVYYNKEVTDYHWPNSFKEANQRFELKEFDLKLKDKKQIWIGPFEYIPSSNQVCIFARINTENDTAIVNFNSKHNLPLWMIVPYDNNIAVRIFK